MKLVLAAALLGALLAGAAYWLQPPPDQGQALRARPGPRVASEVIGTAAELPEERSVIDAAGPANVPARPQAAQAELVEEPPEEELDPDSLPPDLLEVGTAALDLRILDAESREAIVCRAELWRLDAPGNAGWTAGAQLQASAEVPVDGWVFQRLPEGRYRLVIDDQLIDSELRLVEVHAPITRLDLTLERPRSFRVFVEVRDERGVPLDGLRCDPYHSIHSPAEAPWSRERQLRESSMTFDLFAWETTNPQTDLRELGVQPPGGFDLGEFVERRRSDGGRHEPRLFSVDGAEIRVPIPERADRDVHLVAIALSPSVVRESIRRAGDSGLEVDAVSVTSRAQPRLEDTPEGGWERVPVTIRVQREGASDTTFTWSPEQGEFPLLHLKR